MIKEESIISIEYVKAYNQAIIDILEIKYPECLEYGFPKAIQEHKKSIKKLLK